MQSYENSVNYASIFLTILDNNRQCRTTIDKDRQRPCKLSYLCAVIHNTARRGGQRDTL